MIHRLTYSAGAQTIRTVPMDQYGRAVRVASATYAIVDTRYDADDSAHEVVTGAASVDSVNTTLAAAAGKSSADPRAVTVTSAVGITAGRRYLLTTGGRNDLVRVVGVDGTTVRLSAPVASPFPSGALFQGVEISCSVPADSLADEEYLDRDWLAVRWTPDGLQPWLESIYVERVGPTIYATADDVTALDGTLAAYADEHMSIQGALAQATDDLRVDLLNAGHEDSGVLAGPIGKRAVVHQAAWHLLKSSAEPSAVTRAERYAARYTELKNGLVQGLDKAKTARLTPDLARKGDAVQSRFRDSW